MHFLSLPPAGHDLDIPACLAQGRFTAKSQELDMQSFWQLVDYRALAVYQIEQKDYAKVQAGAVSER